MAKKATKIPGDDAGVADELRGDPEGQIETDMQEAVIDELGQSDVDEAIGLAQSGKARKIVKPKPQVAPSPVKGDPERPPEAAVNAKREMTYDEAMAAHAAACELRDLKEDGCPFDPDRAQVWRARVAELEGIALKKSVLTEKGWVSLPNPRPPKGARNV